MFAKSCQVLWIVSAVITLQEISTTNTTFLGYSFTKWSGNTSTIFAQDWTQKLLYLEWFMFCYKVAKGRVLQFVYLAFARPLMRVIKLTLFVHVVLFVVFVLFVLLCRFLVVPAWK